MDTDGRGWSERLKARARYLVRRGWGGGGGGGTTLPVCGCGIGFGEGLGVGSGSGVGCGIPYFFLPTGGFVIRLGG